MCDLRISREKPEDLEDSHGSHFEDLYLHEPSHTLNKDDAIKEGLSHHEGRIHNSQMFGLLLLCIEKFDELMARFDVLEEVLSLAGQSQDNV